MGCADPQMTESSAEADALMDLDSVERVTPLEVAIEDAEAAEAAPAPLALQAWVLSSFGFLYAGEDGSVDALDIDGVVTTAETPAEAGTCAHADLSAPTGVSGVDHQLLHLVQAFESLGQDGIADMIIDNSTKDGSMTIVLTERADGVGLVMAQEPPVTGNDGEVLPFSSFSPYEDTAYHAHLSPMEVVDGALVAGPTDVRLRLKIQIVEADLFLKDAYIRLAFADDGTAHGVLQGYWASEGIVEILASTGAHLLALGYTLEEFQGVLDAHADVDPNEEGVCQALSAAFRFKAEPAYLLGDEEGP